MSGGWIPLRRIAAALTRAGWFSRVVRFGDGVLTAGTEFLAPDLCCLCRRRARPGGGQLPSRCVHLQGKTRVSPLPPFQVTNHPFCRSCLGSLVPAPTAECRIGVCGVSGGVGWARTDAGELFVCRPQEAAGTVPGVPPGGSEQGAVRVVAPLLMNDTSLEIVRNVKFSGRRSIVPLMAGSIHEAIEAMSWIGPEAVLVPVPMHPSAYRRRGFNQAVLLANELSRLSNLRQIEGALGKKNRTIPQSAVDFERRADNIRDVFSWTGPALDGVHAILVDDLVTSGSTAAACASVLKAAGAGEVTVVCFARAS